MAVARLIPRWKRAPGWDSLLDRADRIVRDHELIAGHRARWRIRAKGGIDCYGDCCSSLMDALSAVEEASRCTCSVCGQPGRERPERPYHIACDRHAVLTIGITGPRRGDDAPLRRATPARGSPASR